MQRIDWRRLSAEAAAIVASILLAFAIDAWWDERSDRAEEKEILESLQVEFEANRREAADVILAHERSVQYVAMLMGLSDDEILALSAEDVERHLRYFANPRTFDAIRGSVDALTSAGKLGLLRLRKNTALMGYVNRNRENSVRYASEIRLALQQIESILALIEGSSERET